MLLLILLFAQLLQLEHLQPTLVAEECCAELDHLRIYSVVGWDLCDKPTVARLNEGYHLQVNVNALLNLLETHATRVDDRLVHVTAIVVPQAPVLLLTLVDEVADIVVGAVPQTSQNAKLSLRSRICLDLKALSAVNDVFSHADFELELRDHAVQSPSIELNIPGHLFSDQQLQLLHSSVLRLTLHPLVQSPLVALLIDEQLLLMLINVKFKQVLSHQILDLLLVALDLILHPHCLSILVLVQLPPDSLDLRDPYLMCRVGIDVRHTIIALNRHEVLQRAHVVLVDLLAEDFVSDFDIRKLLVNRLNPLSTV